MASQLAEQMSNINIANKGNDFDLSEMTKKMKSLNLKRKQVLYTEEELFEMKGTFIGKIINDIYQDAKKPRLSLEESKKLKKIRYGFD